MKRLLRADRSPDATAMTPTPKPPGRNPTPKLLRKRVVKGRGWVA